MYRHILIPLENSRTDDCILEHVKPLARLTGAKLLLMHVADGWAACSCSRRSLSRGAYQLSRTTPPGRFVVRMSKTA